MLAYYDHRTAKSEGGGGNREPTSATQHQQQQQQGLRCSDNCEPLVVALGAHMHWHLSRVSARYRLERAGNGEPLKALAKAAALRGRKSMHEFTLADPGAETTGGVPPEYELFKRMLAMRGKKVSRGPMRQFKGAKAKRRVLVGVRLLETSSVCVVDHKDRHPYNHPRRHHYIPNSSLLSCSRSSPSSCLWLHQSRLRRSLGTC